MKQPRRVIMRVIVFLILGAIVNVTVAWGCSIWVDVNAPGFSESWYEEGQRYIHRPGLTRIEGESLIDVRGWPVPSLRCEYTFSFPKERWVTGPSWGGIDIGPTDQNRYWSTHRAAALPLRPVWHACFINTAVYALAAWVLSCMWKCTHVLASSWSLRGCVILGSGWLAASVFLALGVAAFCARIHGKTQAVRDVVATPSERRWYRNNVGPLSDDYPLSADVLNEFGISWIEFESRFRKSGIVPAHPSPCCVVAGWPLKCVSTGWRPKTDDKGFGSVIRAAGIRLFAPDLLPQATYIGYPVTTRDEPAGVGLLWPGFLIDTCLCAAVLWPLMFGLLGLSCLRRRRRIKRGLCPACAYPVGTSAVCTECGCGLSPPGAGGAITGERSSSPDSLQ